MRRIAGMGIAAAIVVAVGAWLWDTPSVALLRLKRALDRQDLAAVRRAVDREALTDAALARLVVERPSEAETIRLVLRGESGWLPAVTSARAYLRVRLDRALERLVEDPEAALRVSWGDVRDALAGMRRTGAVAVFPFRRAPGEEYRVRLRRARGRWRVAAVERDGEPALLGPAVAEEAAPAPASAATAPPLPEVGDEAHEERFAMMLDEAAVLADSVPPPRRRGPARRPFARRLDGSTWTVQVASTRDALEADVECERLTDRGEVAFVVPADVGGQLWQRVMIGRYATFAEAERTVERLSEQLASWRP